MDISLSNFRYHQLIRIFGTDRSLQFQREAAWCQLFGVRPFVTQSQGALERFDRRNKPAVISTIPTATFTSIAVGSGANWSEYIAWPGCLPFMQTK
jgi:hypothetical protein